MVGILFTCLSRALLMFHITRFLVQKSLQLNLNTDWNAEVIVHGL